MATETPPTRWKPSLIGAAIGLLARHVFGIAAASLGIAAASLGIATVGPRRGRARRRAGEPAIRQAAVACFILCPSRDEAKFLC